MDIFEAVLLLVVIYMLHDIRQKMPHKETRPDSAYSEHNTSNATIFDTSALIDGRVLHLIEQGFLNGAFIVPLPVTRELQQLADGRDAHKRTRARHGFAVLRDLQKNHSAQVEEGMPNAAEELSVDELVLFVAKTRKARLCTTDFNLAQVARSEGVQVLNVNELAESLRAPVLPGEHVDVAVLKKGESKGQGVGYLDDGTLVVIESGFRFKGKTITVQVERVVQNQSGKMIFAKILQS